MPEHFATEKQSIAVAKRLPMGHGVLHQWPFLEHQNVRDSYAKQLITLVETAMIAMGAKTEQGGWIGWERVIWWWHKLDPIPLFCRLPAPFFSFLVYV